MCCPHCRPQTASVLDGEKQARINDMPLAQKREKLVQIVEEGERELKRLQSISEFITTQTIELDACMLRVKLLLTPISTLPFETLIKIFREFIEDAGGVLLTGCDRLSIPPNVLGSVCKLWREITVSTPSLWTELYVNLETGIIPAKLDMILSRSQNSLLNLKIISDWKGYESRNDDALESLARECGRWRRLSLLNPWNILCSSSFPSFSEELPNLEHLEVSYPIPESFGPLPLDMFQHATKLRSLKVAEMGPHLTLPWSQLTSIECIISTDIQENMSLCKDASILSIFFDPKYISNYALDVEHNYDFNCRDLELDLNEGTDMGNDYPHLRTNYIAIIQGISCPQLQALKITDSKSKLDSSGGAPETFPLGPIQALALQSRGQLRSLTISYIPFHPDDSFSEFLAELPLLENLSIVELATAEFPVLRTSLLEDLTAFNSTTQNDASMPQPLPLCPRLTKLEFGVGESANHFSIFAFKRLVESRWFPDRISMEVPSDGVACLRKVIFSSPADSEGAQSLMSSVFQSLHSVQEKGMDVDTGKHYDLPEI
jgi:hypothetical protein